MLKELKDFTIEEIVNRATNGFGKQDTEGHARFADERSTLKIVMDFKISQRQDEINTNLAKLTKWLVILTIALVILTICIFFR